MGSLVWSRQTQGKMCFFDQVNYVKASIKVQLKLFMPFQAHQPKDLDLDTIVIPDTPLVKETQAFVAEKLTDAFFNHSIRAYFWGSMLKMGDRREFDAETFYLSCLLHDLGIADQVHGHYADANCFTLESIQAGQQVLSKHGCSLQQQTVIDEAITLHLNPVVEGEKFGWVAHYLNAGTACDIVGARFKQISRNNRKSVLQKYPRMDLKHDVIRVMRREAELHPCSRMALMKRFGFFNLVKNAPFDS